MPSNKIEIPESPVRVFRDVSEDDRVTLAAGDQAVHGTVLGVYRDDDPVRGVQVFVETDDTFHGYNSVLAIHRHGPGGWSGINAFVQEVRVDDLGRITDEVWVDVGKVQAFEIQEDEDE